jgi:hypothetical protein
MTTMMIFIGAAATARAMMHLFTWLDDPDAKKDHTAAANNCAVHGYRR